MKRRSNVFILMRLLELLIEEPRGPTRLAQGVNTNYVKLEEYLGVLDRNALITKEIRDGHQIYHASQKGRDVYYRWASIFEELKVT